MSQKPRGEGDPRQTPRAVLPPGPRELPKQGPGGSALRKHSRDSAVIICPPPALPAKQGQAEISAGTEHTALSQWGRGPYFSRMCTWMCTSNTCALIH